jgi:hypothetical protein
MIRHIGITGLGLTATLALIAIAVSPASANPPLGCYKAQREAGGGVTGNYKNATCTEKSAALKAEYVLAEPLEVKKGDVWCAKLTPAAATGLDENSTCTKIKANGEFTEVIVTDVEPSTRLPDISLTLAAGIYPLHLNFADNGRTPTTFFERGDSRLIEGEDGLSLLLLVRESSTAGEFQAAFLDLKFTTKLCTTSGDARGVLLVEGSFHLVYTDLSPLALGILYLLDPVEIECENELIELRGSMVSSLNTVGTERSELTTASVQFATTKDKAAIAEYYNDNGTKLRAELESNAGTGFEEAAVSVGGEPPLTALEGKMFVISHR